MEILIKWEYLNKQNERVVFPQICNFERGIRTGNVKMPPFCAGMYISNLFGACKVEEEAEGYLDSSAYTEWEKIVGNNYIEANRGEKNVKFILYDSVSYPAYCIFKDIRTMLEDVGGVENTDREMSECTKRILGEDYLILRSLPDDELAKYIQRYIDSYMREYNTLLTASKGEYGTDYYVSLCNCLKKYKGSELIGQYLSENGKKARCFATFIKDETDEKYISFSGFLDARDWKIISWLQEKLQPFTFVAEEICYSMNATFVPINLQTKTYRISGYNPIAVVQSLSLDEVIDINLRSMKKYYSCCERKIFGFFGDNVPDGKLYVKMKICGECDLGLLYQSLNGSKIKLYDGLMC